MASVSGFQCPPITHLSDPGDLHLPLGRTSDLAHRGPCSPRLLPTHVRAWGSALGPAYTLPAQPEPQGLLQKGETCFQTSGPGPWRSICRTAVGIIPQVRRRKPEQVPQGG